MVARRVGRWGGVWLMVLLAGGLMACKRQPAPALVAPCFTDDERKVIAAYWNAPGRYVVEPSPDPRDVSRVNITVVGSAWQSKFNALVATRPRGDAEVATWQAFVASRQGSDAAVADPKLAAVVNMAPPVPLPDTLKAALGDPPRFYEAVHPVRYTVTFAPGDDPAGPFVYTDNISFVARKAYYPSYRQTVGVIKPGKPIRTLTGDDRARVDALFAQVAKSETERHVLQAVSALEGGFESINTYDTGYVSVGLIQFIFARDGSGSLSSVLARMKADTPGAFQADFRRFGIDVIPGQGVVCFAPALQAELHGADAVQGIINDKRLTAVFERAGLRDPFRRAQVLIARSQYWPGDDTVTVTQTTVTEQVGTVAPVVRGVYFGTPSPDRAALLAQGAARGQTDPAYHLTTQTTTLSARVSDIIHSEAGLATLMDRKVNTGNLRLLNTVAADALTRHKLTRLADLAPYEREIVDAMRYRTDFRKDATLTQPPAPPQP